jgi:hypothetical protein
VHDKGDKICDYCQGNCWKLIIFKDKNVGKVNICRKCYKRVTGYKCRAEERMINQIKQNNKIGPFIVLTNKIIANDSCNTKRRPDVLISSGKMHIIIECDERQHRSYSPICESGRMDEIIDELKTGQIIFIRWNPDHCRFNRINKPKSIQQRIDELEIMILKLVTGKKYTKDPIKIIYMFYDKDNPVIANRWPKIFYN